MCGLKTSLRALALAVLLSPAPPAWAETDAATEQLRFFATCTGRLSALMEHQWMFDGPASDLTKDRRDAMLSLVEAVALPGDERRALIWRVEAKAAQAALLQQAAFGQAANAERARHLSDRLMGDCTAAIS
jgi:hypothetical protein